VKANAAKWSPEFREDRHHLHDRQTGEFLCARPTNFQNVISKIDGATGVVTVNPAAQFTKTLWKFNSRTGVLPLMATGGGLVFGGDVNGIRIALR
jgi:hypothetical protein